MTDERPHLARLPELTYQELSELHHALVDRRETLMRLRLHALDDVQRDALLEKIAICNSLTTAVAEAKTQFA